jgi:hypothetical protein
VVLSNLRTVANTGGFRSTLELIQHFADHAAEFAATTAVDYEAMADAFWADPKPAHVLEHRRRRGDLVRFDTITETMSVVDSKSMIRTFFKPVPCSSLPIAQRAAIKLLGRCHDKADNLLYFHSVCSIW